MTVKEDARLEVIKQKIADLAKEAKIIQVQRSSKERKLDGRRKVILGSMLMAKYPGIATELIGDITRAQDKAVFEGWTVKEPPQMTM